MSEKKPFDAIKITPLFGIDWVLSLLRACREINKDKPEHQKWIDEAYRVIEVVGKVDKTRCKEWLSFRSYYLNPTPRDQATKNQINALLEALPEPGKEKK